MSDWYLVWSNEHRAWWRPNSSGYTKQVSDAGRYSREKAISIAHGRGWPTKGIPDEVPVREDDAIECLLKTANHTKED